MSKDQIFISYRRDDSAGYVRALYDRLVQHFAKERVFMDVDAIDPGLPFDEAIRHALDQCKVLLVMIGRRWMDKKDGKEPRINDPKDFVRIEIAAALSRNIYVIPVLVDGASMPGEEELPEPLRALARRNAIEISNSRFDSDTETLITAVLKAVDETERRATPGKLRRNRAFLYWLAGGLAVGVLVTMAYLYSGLLDMRPDINGEWRADVTYDWPNARYDEKFYFRGKGEEVYGTASFLGTKRGILEGSLRKNALQFITRTKEIRGADIRNPKDSVHHYRGEFLGKEIKFIMQTEGGYSEHVPIEFVAKKVAKANEADVVKSTD
jgi:hypothetical protein